MTKRLTESDKWRDPWFRKLPSPWGKLLWVYLIDNCDCAGVWQVDVEFCEMLIGVPVPWNDVPVTFGDRLRVLADDKWLLPKFVLFQMPKGLDPKNSYARAIIARMAYHGLTADALGVQIIDPGSREGQPGVDPRNTIQSKDKAPSPSKSLSSLERLRATLRRCGLAVCNDADREWADLMQGLGGCTTVDDALDGIAWIVTEAAKRGTPVRFAKHAADLAREWAAK